MIIKKSKNNSKWNGLSIKNSFDLEYECLELINNNFKCKCKCQKNNHFPKIISCNKDNFIFELSDCGISLNNYRQYVKQKKIKPIKIVNLDEQIDCIISNLKEKKIKHLDMTLCGKNLCINSNGIISLIDFDIAAIDDKFMSEKIKARDHDNYYIWLKQRIINITKKL